MSNENSTKKTSVDQQDFVTFEPEPLMLMPMEKMKVIREYFWTLRVLRGKAKTAKEIHREVGKLGQKFTIKTIYRHLRKLEENGFVTVAGHRHKKGKRIPEKLYHRTARIFFLDPKEEIEGTVAEEEAQRITESVAHLLYGLYQIESGDRSALNEVVWQFFDTQRRIRGEMLEKATSNEELADFFARTEMDKLNYYSDIATSIAAFLRRPELLEKLQDLLEK
jgi:DNA-binding transcriptional ArsR family regulator